MKNNSLEKITIIMPNIYKIHEQWDSHNTIVLITEDYSGTVNISNDPVAKESWIHGLWVNEPNRRSGIATALLDKAEQYAKFPIYVGLEDSAPEWLVKFYKKRKYHF